MGCVPCLTLLLALILSHANARTIIALLRELHVTLLGNVHITATKQSEKLLHATNCVVQKLPELVKNRGGCCDDY